MRGQPIRKLDFRVPIKTVSEMNRRDHWAVKNDRKKSQQEEIMIALQNNLVGRKVQLPCVVKLIRIGPRKLDQDNLASSLKFLIDAIAQKLGVDDGDETKVSWQISQMPVGIRDYAVKVSIESL